MGRSRVTVRSRLCYVLKAGGCQNPKLKRPTVLVVDDDSPVLQDRLRRWQNANRWIRFGRLSVSQVYPSLFRSAGNFCSPQIGPALSWTNTFVSDKACGAIRRPCRPIGCQILRIHTKQSITKLSSYGMKRLIALAVVAICVASSRHLCRKKI